MRMPTGIETFLCTWAVLATGFGWFFMSSFSERASSKNALTESLSQWEMQNRKCLGEEIDRHIWLGGCYVER